jgi:hypothetical protein
MTLLYARSNELFREPELEISVRLGGYAKMLPHKVLLVGWSGTRRKPARQCASTRVLKRIPLERPMNRRSGC